MQVTMYYVNEPMNPTLIPFTLGKTVALYMVELKTTEKYKIQKIIILIFKLLENIKFLPMTEELNKFNE